MKMTAFVHPIDTREHPTCPSGWRWAVHLGSGPPDDMTSCLNAGWAADKHSAIMLADSHSVIGVLALRSTKIQASYEIVELSGDPIPAAYDRLPLRIVS
jgi:hypothetical protein